VSAVAARLPATRRRRSRDPGRSLLWLLLVAIVVLYAFPFAYLVLTSFKDPTDAIAVPPTVFPRSWSLESFGNAVHAPNVSDALLHSVEAASLSTIISLFLAVPAAYGVVRYATPTGQVFILTALVARMVPPVAIGVPMIGIMSRLDLSDSPLGLALAHTTLSLPLSIWLMASFLDAVPRELEEAASVDGCGRLGALWRVVVPVVSGGIAVTAIFAFLASWNEFLFALLLTATKAQTMPIVIANFQTQFGLQWGTMTALATLYSIPVVLLSLVLQRRIVAGLTLGAVKG
jgi:multiple sugar transport system permease protein